jgi:hypothetical protein
VPEALSCRHFHFLATRTLQGGFCGGTQSEDRLPNLHRGVLGLTEGEIVNGDVVEFELGNATFAIDSSSEMMGMPRTAPP